MPSPIPRDRTGTVYGDLVALRPDGHAPNGKAKWLCRCICGAVASVKLNNLVSGITKSCGCRKHRAPNSSLRTHGLTGTPAHRAWKAAKQRCFSPNASNYPYYGGRGITMATEWRLDFAAFLRDMGQPPEGRPELDRINSAGNYEPGNCRWASRGEQVRNTSRSVWVDYQGERMVLKDFAAKIGASYHGLLRRKAALGLTSPIDGSALA